MDELLTKIQKMRVDCGWDKSDNLPILIKSVAVEASELLETIQWDENNIDLQAIKNELADVLMYALSICIDNKWNVEEIIDDKMKDVYRRYKK